MVIFDYDLDYVDILCKFDMKVFYGDVIWVDLLELVGVEKVEVLINVIDDLYVSLELVVRVKEYFLYLQIIFCVCDVDYYIQLCQVGVEVLECEIFEVVLKFG